MLRLQGVGGVLPGGEGTVPSETVAEEILEVMAEEVLEVVAGEVLEVMAAGEALKIICVVSAGDMIN